MLRKLLFISAICFAAAVQAQPREGQPVPAYETRLLDGTTLSAAALNGKVVLVVFWATWCPSCQKELPELQKLYDRHRARGLEILAISVDADRYTVEEFWKDHEYGFPVAMRTQAHTQAFGPVRATPTLFVIDRQGVLRLAHVGGMEGRKLESRLLPLLRN
jgi:peroxiredoxin